MAQPPTLCLERGNCSLLKLTPAAFPNSFALGDAPLAVLPAKAGWCRNLSKWHNSSPPLMQAHNPAWRLRLAIKCQAQDESP
mmetsp:Transcript_32582/g.77442  ORF Transcript_32582/g.77442 Transcript_32582/m.77442 type:complete len:82 (+) Transcript_32582:1267-1512(+)